jgi:hypothetical protein
MPYWIKLSLRQNLFRIILFRQTLFEQQRGDGFVDLHRSELHQKNHRRSNVSDLIIVLVIVGDLIFAKMNLLFYIQKCMSEMNVAEIILSEMIFCRVDFCRDDFAELNRNRNFQNNKCIQLNLFDAL